MRDIIKKIKKVRTSLSKLSTDVIILIFKEDLAIELPCLSTTSTRENRDQKIDQKDNSKTENRSVRS